MLVLTCNLIANKTISTQDNQVIIREDLNQDGVIESIVQTVSVHDKAKIKYLDKNNMEKIIERDIAELNGQEADGVVEYINVIGPSDKKSVIYCGNLYRVHEERDYLAGFFVTIFKFNGTDFRRVYEANVDYSIDASNLKRVQKSSKGGLTEKDSIKFVLADQKNMYLLVQGDVNAYIFDEGGLVKTITLQKNTDEINSFVYIKKDDEIKMVIKKFGMNKIKIWSSKANTIVDYFTIESEEPISTFMGDDAKDEITVRVKKGLEYKMKKIKYNKIKTKISEISEEKSEKKKYLVPDLESRK